MSCRRGDDPVLGDCGFRGDSDGTSRRRTESGEFSSKLSFLGEFTAGLLCFGGEPSSEEPSRLQPLSSPVRFLGLRGSRVCRRGEEGGALSERGDERVEVRATAGRLGDIGPMRPRFRFWVSGFEDEAAGDSSRCGVLP